MTELEQLIQSQAELTRQLRGLLARDPSTEFGQVEGFVGASKRLTVSPRVEFQTQRPSTSNAFGLRLYVSSIYNQLVRVKWWAGNAASSTGVNGIMMRVELGDDIDFQKGVQTTFLLPRISQIQTLVTPATGVVAGDTVYNFEGAWATRKRYVRLALTNTGGVVSSTAVATLFGFSSASIVEFLGE